jgi:hypothetical protein
MPAASAHMTRELPRCCRQEGRGGGQTCSHVWVHACSTHDTLSTLHFALQARRARWWSKLQPRLGACLQHT